MRGIVHDSFQLSSHSLMCQDSCQLLCTHPENLWVDVVWSPSLIGPNPGELLSYLAGIDGNWRCGGGVTVHPAGYETATPGVKGSGGGTLLCVVRE